MCDFLTHHGKRGDAKLQAKRSNDEFIAEEGAMNEEEMRFGKAAAVRVSQKIAHGVKQIDFDEELRKGPQRRSLLSSDTFVPLSLEFGKTIQDTAPTKKGGVPLFQSQK